MGNKIFNEPKTNEISFSVVVTPYSLQTRSKKKVNVKNIIKNEINNYRFYLSGDVVIEIEWLIQQRKRYETNQAPDIDNVIKPLIDAISGPEGLLINDCQVQSIICSWIDTSVISESILFRIRYNIDDWVYKDSLAFVRMRNNLCFPIYLNMPLKANKLIINALVDRFKTIDELIKLRGDNQLTQYLLPVQRMFHSAHLKGFQIVELSSFTEDT